MFQVRIHGRGGQGVVTAAELLSVAAFDEGHHAQAFPSFGSERTGAPVVAFCRIGDEPIRVRIGLHTGEALRDADKFFGKTVIMAARIAAEATGGEILVSSLLKELTQSSGDLSFGAEREVTLKGIAEPQRLLEVVYSTEAS